MKFIPQPIVRPDPPDLQQQLESKIAAMLSIAPTEPPQKEVKLRFRNGMAALAEWEAGKF